MNSKNIVKLFLIFSVIVLTMTVFIPKNEVEAGGQTSGKALYQQYCIKCHGGNGAGTEYGRTLDVPDIRQTPVNRTRNAVTNGSGQMPSFRKKMSKKQIEAVAAYVKTL